MNRNGVIGSLDNAIVQMICGMTLPSSNMASCFASVLSDDSLTELDVIRSLGVETKGLGSFGTCVICAVLLQEAIFLSSSGSLFLCRPNLLDDTSLP